MLILTAPVFKGVCLSTGDGWEGFFDPISFLGVSIPSPMPLLGNGHLGGYPGSVYSGGEDSPPRHGTFGGGVNFDEKLPVHSKYLHGWKISLINTVGYTTTHLISLICHKVV